MRRVLILSVLIDLGIVGCGSHPAVPVVDASHTVVLEPGRTAPAVARPGYHIVKKGETLYRIGQMYGATVGDLASWNSLTDVTKLEVGRELKVTAPNNSAEVKPVASPDKVYMVGDNASVTTQALVPAVAPAATSSATLLREPKGGTVAYSEAALAQVRTTEGSGPAAMPVAGTGQDEKANATSAATGIDWTWPVAGKVIRAFGNESGEINRGIDLEGHKGESISAAAAGKVSFVGTLKEYGNFVVVRHDAEYLSVYGNTSKILVKEGQSVSRGQKIAEIGSSGSDHAKLHFEIRQKSEPVDPLKFLPTR